MPLKSELIKTSIRGTVTESAANTFTEATIDTNLSIRGDHVFIITGLWVNHTATLSANGDAFIMQLAYAPQNGTIGFEDPDCLFRLAIYMHLTTSGATNWNTADYYPINEFPIAVGSLYWGVAGVSLGAAASASFKLEGYHHKVTTTDFFRLAQSR